MQHRTALLDTLIVATSYDLIVNHQYGTNGYAASLQSFTSFLDRSGEVPIHARHSCCGKHVVYFLQQIGRKAVDELQRSHVLVYLFHSTRTGYDATDQRVLQAPGQRELRQTRTHIFCKGFERSDFREPLRIG